MTGRIAVVSIVVGVSFEFGYSFIPASDIVEHELSDSYLGAYFF